MRQIFLRVEDSVFEKFMGMMELCHGVEVVSTGEAVETRDIVDQCFAEAIRELQANQVIKRPADLAYIMIGSNDGAIKDLHYFYCPDDYSGYLEQLGIHGIPSRSTIYNKVNDTIGKYPNWTFVSDVKHKEVLRRLGIVSQFSSTYGRLKRQKLDSSLDK